MSPHPNLNPCSTFHYLGGGAAWGVGQPGGRGSLGAGQPGGRGSLGAGQPGGRGSLGGRAV